MIKRDIKKTEILEKGSKAMYLKGYNATGVQEIVDAAGIPKGSFYNYFKSKEDFAIESMNYLSGRHIVWIEETLKDKSLPPLKRFDRLFSRMIDKFTHEMKFTLGCFVGNLCQEMGDVNTPISKAVEDIFALIIRPFTECLREARERGDIPPSVNVEKLGESIFNSWEGAIMRMKASRSGEPLEAFKYMVFEVLLKK